MATSSKYGIEIGIADKATSVVGKIDKSVAALTKRLASAGSAATRAAEGLGSFGGANSLTSAGSVTGLAMLAQKWADAGNTIMLASRRIGVSGGDLTRFQAAAQLGGASAEQARAGYENLAKGIGDALGNRNPELYAYFRKFNIAMRYTSDGLPDVTAAYRDLAKALATSPTPQGKNFILDTFGQPEDLRYTVENLADLSREAKEFHPNAQAAADAGTELTKAWARVKEGSSGLSENMETVLGPALAHILDQFSDLEKKAVDLTKTPAGSHALAIGGGALAGAKWGAAGGALIGGAMGIPGGPIGMAGGALAGAFWGGLRGGVGGALVAGGTDLVGNGLLAGPRVGKTPTVRWNNPGNLRSGPNSFQTFGTPEEGLVAAAEQLIRDNTVHGLRSVSDIIGNEKWGWAPASDHNNVNSYVADVIKGTGVGPHDNVDLVNNPGLGTAVFGGIVRHEQGREPYTVEQLTAAFTEALKRTNGGQGSKVEVTVNGPPGTTATAQSGSGGYWPARTHYVMPTGEISP